MKYLKHGFSLAELLIAISIIAVLSVMGLTISKKGMDNAANMYFYNAFTSLNGVVYEAVDNGVNLDGQSDLTSAANKEFFKRITESFGVEVNDIDENYDSSNNYVLKARNGVVYTFLKPTSSEAYADKDGNTRYIYLIKIKIPRKKDNLTVCTYISQDDNRMFVPSADSYTQLHIKLAERKDLLPVYLANGDRGKVKLYVNTSESNAKTSSFDAVQYLSYKEAYCKVHGANLTMGTFNVLVCPANSKDSNEADSIIRIVSPRKAF